MIWGTPILGNLNFQKPPYGKPILNEFYHSKDIEARKTFGCWISSSDLQVFMGGLS
jgi:hypothetical protein